ncbi:hypothetical protein STEG23_021015 [Scotinomys teguina]
MYTKPKIKKNGNVSSKAKRLMYKNENPFSYRKSPKPFKTLPYCPSSYHASFLKLSYKGTLSFGQRGEF